jgi:hypothetical protein
MYQPKKFLIATHGGSLGSLIKYPDDVISDDQLVTRGSVYWQKTQVSADGSYMMGYYDGPSDLEDWDGTGLPEKTIVQPPVTPLAFLRRFTREERVSIRGTVKKDPMVEDFLSIIENGQYVDLSDEDTMAGLGYLVSISVLTPARQEEILQTPVKESETYKGVL